MGAGGLGRRRLSFRREFSMRVDAFDFELPESLIALRPAEPRDAARMLVVRPGAADELSDHGVRDLGAFLRPGDALVFNNTKVIPAQLEGRRVGRGDTAPRVSVTLHKRAGGARWHGFARPAKKLEAGDRIVFSRGDEDGADPLLADVLEKGGAGEILLGFDRAEAALDAALGEVGVTPLPPYIASKRKPDARDLADYQTVYARTKGAVAAPTAGLHFTETFLQEIEVMGVSRHFVTLHVGAGTFLPVKADDTADHKMHAEWGEVAEETAAALNEVRARGGRIVAVGTTSLRLLESAADDADRIHPFRGDTDIFITPGYRFRAVDLLLTNFHLPRSTLFMLVSAFSGLETMRRAYAHAIAAGYRFYSYGDASLLHRRAEDA